MSVSKWITMHGFSINLDCDLSGFHEIIPCGLKGKEVTSVKLLNKDISLINAR